MLMYHDYHFPPQCVVFSVTYVIDDLLLRPDGVQIGGRVGPGIHLGAEGLGLVVGGLYRGRGHSLLQEVASLALVSQIYYVIFF